MEKIVTKMVNTCAAMNCTNRNNMRARELGITFHRFPKSPKEREKWTIAMKRIDLKKKDVYWQPHKYDVLCSKHFLKTCFDLTGKRVRLREGAVPSLFDFSFQNSKKKQSRRCIPALKSVTKESSYIAKKKVDLSPVQNSTSNLTTVEKQHPVDLSRPANLDHSYFFMETLNLKHKQSDTEKKHSGLKMDKCTKRNSLRRRRRQTQNSQKVESKDDNSKCSLKSFLEKAQESGILKKCSQELLETFSTMPLNFKASQGLYTSEQLEIALTLYLFVPRAYAHLQEMQITLPCPKTLQSWLCHTDGSPGFLEQIFSLLHEKVKGEHGSQFNSCSLLMECIPLRKGMHWDDSSGKLSGYVDYGFKLNSSLGDNQAIACQVLVLMAVGITGHWKLPLGYFFLDGQPLDVLGEIVKNAFLLLDRIGVSAIALVLDGLTADHKLLELLGGCVTPGKLKCTFPHPSGSGEEVFAFFDVHHLLLLTKNTLAQNKDVHIPNHGIASWEHIIRLKKILDEPSPCSVTKLNTKQLFHRQKVKMQISTEPITASVANTLQILRNGKTLGFLESEGTEVFIKLFDLLFQIFSSQNLYAKGYRAVMTLQQFSFIRGFLDFAEKTLGAMKNSAGEKIIETKNNLFIVGFLLNIQSLRQICEQFLVTEKLKHLLMFKFQHFHLKSFVSCLQSYSKYHDALLTAHQFQANFKDVLEISVGKVTFLMDIFSHRDTNLVSITNSMDHRNSHIITFIDKQLSTDFRASGFQMKNLLKLSSLVDDVIVFWARKMLLRLAKSLKCLDCLETCVDKVSVVSGQIMIMNSGLLQLQGNWGLVAPSLDFLTILRTIRTVLNAILTESGSVDNGTEDKRKQIEMKVLETVRPSFFVRNAEHMLETASGLDNHLFALIRLICKEYLSLCGQ